MSKNQENVIIRLETCSICLQAPQLPTMLPCSHIFCFLCAKGAILQKQQCPLCRKEVSISYLYDPKFVQQSATQLQQQSNLNNFIMEPNIALFDGNFTWFYEGKKSGWWLYDYQTALEIEKNFQQNLLKKFQLLIAGFIFIIDLEQMIQYCKDTPQKIRKIKRDLFSFNNVSINNINSNQQQQQDGLIKGIAGVKTMNFIPKKVTINSLL